MQSDEVHELGAEVLGVSLSARAPYRCAVSLGGGKPPMMLYLEEEDKQSAELPVIGERLHRQCHTRFVCLSSWTRLGVAIRIWL